jgi:hypothetical protein
LSRKRFLDPAAALLRYEDEKMQRAEWLGFSLVAIDCPLVETLIGNERGERTKVGETGKVFKDFL